MTSESRVVLVHKLSDRLGGERALGTILIVETVV